MKEIDEKEIHMFKIWVIVEIISWIIVFGAAQGLYSKNTIDRKGGEESL